MMDYIHMASLVIVVSAILVLSRGMTDIHTDAQADANERFTPATVVGLSKARFPFKRNRLRCVRCVRYVNENRNKRKRQPIGMLDRSSGNHDWLLANASACVSCGFRLRNALNARNGSDCV